MAIHVTQAKYGWLQCSRNVESKIEDVPKISGIVSVRTKLVCPRNVSSSFGVQALRKAILQFQELTPKHQFSVNMFKFKGLDAITLFHKPSLPASMKVMALLKQTAATASETATEDQVGDHSHQQAPDRVEFDLDVTEEAPTPEQLRTIFEYSGGLKADQIIRGAKDEADAMKKLGADPETFQRPVTVDWNNGRVIFGAKESEILKMLATLPK